MKNLTLSKALNLLCHPLSIGAILTILINDHFFRIFWPSWWTGKTSDFAWLFIAPFALASCMAAILPIRVHHRDRLIGYLAFGFIGGIFILANTISSFSAWLVSMLQSLLGFHVQYVSDPTDLIALPSLLIGWKLWRSYRSEGKRKATPGLIALSLAATLTIANIAVQDSGVYCIRVEEDYFVAYANYNSAYNSFDGGLTWSFDEDIDAVRCENDHVGQVFDPNDPGHVLHYSPNGPIEETLDGGNSWKEISLPQSPTEAELAYFLKTTTGLISYTRGPVQGVIDPLSGSVLFAMGYEGVFILQKNGEWITSDVGNYGETQFHQLNKIGNILSLIQGEIIAAFAFGILLFSTLTLLKHHPWPVILIILCAWLLFTASAIVFPPALSSQLYYAAIFQIFLYGVAGILILLGGVVTLRSFSTLTQRNLREIIIISILGAGLFLIPFILWTSDRIPSYHMALVMAYLLGILALLLGIYRMRRAVQDNPSEGSMLDKGMK